jgi:hypothetical protein
MQKLNMNPLLAMVAFWLGLFPLSNAYAFTLGGSGASGLQGWNTTTLTFNVNPTGCGVSQAAFESIIDNAIAIWNTAPASKLKLARGSTTSSTAAQAYAATASDGPVIACSTTFAALTGQSANSVAGVGGYSSLAGVITNGGLVINAEVGGSAAIFNLSTTTSTVIMAHEIGHVLGLGHSGDTQALMYYDATSKQTTALSQDDMDGIAWLYPRQEFGTQFMGCGSVAVISAAGASSTGGWAGLLEMLGLVGFARWASRRRRGGSGSR